MSTRIGTFFRLSKRRRTWLLGGSLFLLSGTLTAFYVLHPAPLKPYVSPPLGPGGLRVSLLIPEGWQQEMTGYGHDNGDLYLSFVPIDRGRHWPLWVRRLLGLYQRSCIYVALIPTVSPPLRAGIPSGGPAWIRVNHPDQPTIPASSLHRWLTTGGRTYSVTLEYQWNRTLTAHTAAERMLSSVRLEVQGRQAVGALDIRR